MGYTVLKKRVFETNLELVNRGLVIYTWGNVSAIDRESGVLVIKPRGIAYDEMEAEDMSVVDLSGKSVEGKLLPSVDLDIHLALYERFPEIGGVAHTHSTYATSWAQACRPIPVFGTTHADHFYGAIPCTPILPDEQLQGDAYERNSGNAIANLFTDGRAAMQVPGALMACHGPFTWGDTPESAVEHSVILEEIARMASITLQANPRTPPIQRSLLDTHYLRKYGPDAYFYQSKE